MGNAATEIKIYILMLRAGSYSRKTPQMNVDNIYDFGVGFCFFSPHLFHHVSYLVTFVRGFSHNNERKITEKKQQRRQT